MSRSPRNRVVGRDEVARPAECRPTPRPGRTAPPPISGLGSPAVSAHGRHSLRDLTGALAREIAAPATNSRSPEETR
jgi:hypothetical protein